MVATIEQYAAAQRAVIRRAQIQFGVWLLQNPTATRQQVGDAARLMIGRFAPVADLLADAWFDDVMGADDELSPPQLGQPPRSEHT